MNNNYQRPPGWFIIAVIVMLLPLLFWPSVITDVLVGHDSRDTVSVLFFIFPLYAVLSCYYAYKSYEARRDLSVILLCVLLLAYVGCCFLVLV